ARGVCAPAETAVSLDALVLAEHSGQRQPSDYPAVPRKALQDVSELKTTGLVRLYPTPDQGAILHAHGQEDISTVNVLVQALDSAVLPEDGQDASPKDFTAALPSAVKNQALRAARCVWKRSCDLGIIPVLRKPICQGNNQHGRIEGDLLLIPVYQTGRVGQIAMRCRGTEPLGKPGSLRVKRKRGKWVADVADTLPVPQPTTDQGIMGIDLGVQVPAVVHVIPQGHRFFGNGRYQRAMSRRVYAHRKAHQKAQKVRAVRKSAGTERRWMRASNPKLSHEIVSHAHVQGGVSSVWNASPASASGRSGTPHAQAAGPSEAWPAQTIA